MFTPVLLSLLAVASASPQAVIPKHDLPQLFSYDHGSHSVAVYRGAALKQAIAAGLVPGFGSLKAGAGAGGAAREARVLVQPTPTTPRPTTARPTLPPPPPPTMAPAPVCCASRQLTAQLDNMRRQVAALQAALAAMEPELMDLPQCA